MNKWIIGLFVLVVGGITGWYLMQAKPKEEMSKFAEVTETADQVPNVDTTAESGSGSAVPSASTTVTYEDAGFTPKTITVKKGTTVRFVSTATDGMWVASAVHPTHQLLPGFDQMKSVAKGGTYDYAFVKVGTWKYHNHVNASDTGTVVVTE